MIVSNHGPLPSVLREDAVERRHQPQAVVEVRLVVLEQVDDAVEVVERRLQVGTGVAHEPGELLGELARRDQEVVDRLAAGDEGAEQRSPSFISPMMSSLAVAQHAGDLARGCCSSVLSSASRAAMFSDSRETPRSAARKSSGVLRVSVGERVEASRELVGVDRSVVSASPANASTTSYGDLVRSSGIVGPFLHLAGAGGLEGQEHRAEQASSP